MLRRARLAGMVSVLSVVAQVATTPARAQTPPSSATVAQVPPAPSAAMPSSAAPVAPAAPLSKERDARLRARVAEYYAARKERDVRPMYNLQEPAYRAAHDFAAYAKVMNARLRFTLLKFDVASIVAQPDDAALVTMALQMELDRFGANPVEPADRWVWRDGDWWITFQDAALPFQK